MLAGFTLEVAHRKKAWYVQFLIVPAVLGFAAWSIAWSLGPENVESYISILVYAGMAGVIAISMESFRRYKKWEMKKKSN